MTPTIQTQQQTKAATLRLRKPQMTDIAEIRRIFAEGKSRTCDYTVGGIMMWSDLYDYRIDIVDDTLFLLGRMGNHPDRYAFSLPIGRMDMVRATELLRRFCSRTGMQLRFSAIPEDALGAFASIGICNAEEIPDLSDYLYDIADLATLKGKKYNKKRNHVNRFVAEHPGARLAFISNDVAARAIASDFMRWTVADEVMSAEKAEERRQTLKVLDAYTAYGFEGAALMLEDGSVGAFTVGERVRDTLYIHIEKMRHDIAGAGEAINMMFAAEMLRRDPSLRFVNREDDAGDPGLRHAKESYHPCEMLRKYNLEI